MQEPIKKQFEIIKLLGSGGFGCVYLARRKVGIDQSEPYAMKVIKKEFHANGKEKVSHRRCIRNEMEILEKIRGYPFLVQLHYAFDGKHSTYFIMDYVGGGDLDKLLVRRNNGDGLERSLVRFFIAECVLALEFLHAQHIIHRDIKPSNIMIDFDGHVVVTDMGLSRYLPHISNATVSVCGTKGYTAPEIWRRSACDERVDWWSLGVLTYVLIFGYSYSGLLPFFSSTEQLLEGCSLDLNLPGVLWHKARDFLKSLINLNPHDRMDSGDDTSIEQIKKHPFFSPINWASLKKKQLRQPYIPIHANEFDTQHFDSFQCWREASGASKKQETNIDDSLPVRCAFIARWYQNRVHWYREKNN